MTCLTIVSSCAVAVALGAVVAAQQTRPPVFRGSAERVRIDALVTNRGRPVRGLVADDFEIKDNGTVVPALEIATTMGGVSVAVALDLSGSVQLNGWAEMVNACEALIDALEPRDTAWFLTFSGEIALRAGPVRNRFALRRALADIETGGSTSMWDALFGSVAVVSGQPGRSLVLLLSDGVDTSSYLDERRALEVLRRSEVVVTAIRPRYAPDGFIGLENAAKATGGEILEAKKSDAGRRQLVDLLSEFRLGYVLTYRPTGLPEPKNGWHDIEVQLKKKPGQVRARQGYYAAGK